MERLLVIAALVLPVVIPTAAGAPEDLLVHEIRAVLEPPFTHYEIEAISPGLKTITYRWSLTLSGACNDFSSDGATARWRHDHETRCPHDAEAHPGTITVSVSDGTNEVTRSYTGGSAGHDPGPPRWTRGEGPGPFIGGNETGDDPRDQPPPAIFGEELDCPGTVSGGVFEPVQAVWQDENPDLFPDLDGKRLTHVSPTRHRAELDMVVGKLTQLFGVRGARDRIHFEGTVTGTVSAPAVVRWTYRDGSGANVLGEIGIGDLPILGACGAPRVFTKDFDTQNGLAIPHFVPKVAGAYSLTMELARKGGEVVRGTKVLVEGTATKVHEPRVYFVGVTMRPDASAQGIAAAARRIADDSAANIPDYFPLPSQGFHVVVRPVERDLRSITAQAAEDCAHPEGIGAFDWCFVERVRAGVETHFAAGSWQLGTGATGAAPDRIAIVVTKAEMDWLYPPAGTAAGFAASTKVFFVADDTDHRVVAHEFAHTTPAFAWLHEAPACTVDYHNKWVPYGHGFQVSRGGKPVRIPKPIQGGVMSGSPPYWIEQCTYWHLLNQIPKLADPTLVGIRGWIAKDGDFHAAAFESGLTFDGIPDREPGGNGTYRVVLRDAKGATLATYPFDHPFADTVGSPRHLVPFSMAVERPAGLARFDLESPEGTLATRNVSSSAPVLRVTSPLPESPIGAAPLDVVWTATDADGDALRYGVAISPDGGETWHDVAFDVARTSVNLDPAFLVGATSPRLRVTATDGVNSHTVEIPLAPADPSSGTPPSNPATGPSKETPTKGTPAPAFALVAAVLAVAALAARRRT